MPVFFHAARGGLHEHVRSLVCLLTRSGHECVLMCPPGPFADELSSVRGVTALANTFEAAAEAAARALAHGPFDLVHTHPLRAREVGLLVSNECGCPLIATFHGMYTDDVEVWGGRASAIVCVSQAIRDFLASACPSVASRCLVIPNGVDTDVFKPLEHAWQQSPGVLEGADWSPPDGPVALVVSRLHADKTLIVHSVEDLITGLARESTPPVAELWIAGEGPLESRLRDAAARAGLEGGKVDVRFLGWRNAEELAQLYNLATVAIVPGRSVLEAMACGTPAIAVSSKAYFGLVDSSSLLKGYYSNFGGVGAVMQTYRSGMLLRDVTSAASYGDLVALRGLYERFTSSWVCQRLVDEQMTRLYEIATLLRAAPLEPSTLSYSTGSEEQMDPVPRGRIASATSFVASKFRLR